MKRSPPPGAAAHTIDRVDKAMRAFRKNIVHLVGTRGEKLKFDDATRAELIRALSRVNPSPSPRKSGQMIAFAQRVVSDLTAAREIEKELKTANEKQALLHLIECAEETRKACDAVFDRQLLRYALNGLLFTGIVKTHFKGVD